MAHKITPQSWMINANACKLLDSLTSKGASARFVGGCVRDALLGREINDVDIATDATPDTVINLLDDAAIKTIPTGIKHGTITAIVNHEPYEITTLRQDIETDGRHALVAYSNNWQEDAARRDFTMNAMSLDRDGTLHDYFGGYEDARMGIVRFVGNPDTRLREDYLRLLRFYRFHAFYGKKLDQPSLNACEALVYNMRQLSGERIRQELLKLIKAPDPIPVLSLMQKGRIFNHLFTKPDFDLTQDDLVDLKNYLSLENDHHLGIDSLCRLAVLFRKHLDEKQARKLANRIVLSNQDKADWLLYCLQNISIDKATETRENFFQLDHLGVTNFKKLLYISAATQRTIIDDRWDDFLYNFGNKTFPLLGRDVMALGLSKGPLIGELLKKTRQWWLEGGFKANKDDCLTYLSWLAKNS